MYSNNSKRVFRGVYNPISKKFKLYVYVDFLWNEFQEFEFDINETRKHYKFSVVVSRSQTIDYFLYVSESPELGFEIFDYDLVPILDKPFFISLDLSDMYKELAELENFRKHQIVEESNINKDIQEPATKYLLRLKSFENIGIDVSERANEKFISDVEIEISNKKDCFWLVNGDYEYYFLRRGDLSNIFYKYLLDGHFLVHINPFILTKFSNISVESIEYLQSSFRTCNILNEIFHDNLMDIANYLERERDIADIFFNLNVVDVSFFSLEERDYYVVKILEKHKNL